MNLKFVASVALSIACSILNSCKEDDITKANFTRKLKVVNAIPSNGPGFLIEVNGKRSALDSITTLDYFPHNGSFTFDVGIGKEIPIKIFNPSDTLSPIIDTSYVFDATQNYSLFLSGLPGEKKIDVTLVEDRMITVSDTAVALRFVNMSPNSREITVNLIGQEAGPQVTSLAYKEYTYFKLYPIKDYGELCFEIRSSKTGELLSTYCCTTSDVTRTQTILIRGLVDGDPSVETVKIEHF